MFSTFITLVRNPYVILGIGAVASGLYLLGYYQGRESVKYARVVEVVREVKRVQKVRENVARMSDGAAATELRNSWSTR